MSERTEYRDTYPVGVLKMLQISGRALTHPGLRGKRLAIVRREFRSEWRFIIGYCIKGRRWRALRNTFNGYLSEHRHGGHDAGRGWTMRAAQRRVERICRASAPAEATSTPREDEGDEKGEGL